MFQAWVQCLLDRGAEGSTWVGFEIAGGKRLHIAVVVGGGRLDEGHQGLFGQFASGIAIQIRGQQCSRTDRIALDAEGANGIEERLQVFGRSGLRGSP